MAAAGPTHYQAFFVEVQWEDGLRSLGDSGLPREYVPLSLPFTQSLHFSPLEELLRRHACGFKGKEREWGGESRENCFLFLFQTCCRTKLD